MVQKLYASVAISLFGSIGLRLVMVGGDFLKSGQPIVNKKVIAMAFVVLCVVLLVGFGLSFLGNVHVPSMRLVVGSAILSAIYTLASFISKDCPVTGEAGKLTDIVPAVELADM